MHVKHASLAIWKDEIFVYGSIVFLLDLGPSSGWAPKPVSTWRRENSWPYWDSDTDPYVIQPVDSRYTDWDIPAK
jgi:hypothetical protein